MCLFFMLWCEVCSNVKPDRVSSVKSERKLSSRHLGLLSGNWHQQNSLATFSFCWINLLGLKLR